MQTKNSSDNNGGMTPLRSFATWAMSPPAIVAYSLAYSIVFILSLVNNTAVLVVVKQIPQLRTVTNYFLANLAAADLIVTFVVLPITLLSNIFTGESSSIPRTHVRYLTADRLAPHESPPLHCHSLLN